MVSSDTTYNLKQRMPRFSRKGAGTCRFPRRCGYIGYIQPVPVPRLQVSIKINYGFILTQYLVSCQLEYTIYSISFCCYFHLFKFFSKFFKFLSPPGYLLYRSAFYRGWSFVLWQLKNIHHHVYGFWWVAPCFRYAIRPDWIAHSAARQRGRGGRRRRWWEVCVDNLLTYFILF